MSVYRPRLIVLFVDDDGFKSFLKLNRRLYNNGSVDRSYFANLTAAQGAVYEEMLCLGE